MPFDQRSLTHREAWFLGGPRIPRNPICLKNAKIIQNAKTQKHLEICQNQRYALRPEVSNPSGSVVFTMFCKAKSATKKTFFARRFLTIFKQKWSNLIPLLSITFPQGSRISKNIGHPSLGSGGKKTFKRYLKSEHTHGRTVRQTDVHFDLQKASAQRADALKTSKPFHFGGDEINFKALFWIHTL